MNLSTSREYKAGKIHDNAILRQKTRMNIAIGAMQNVMVISTKAMSKIEK